MAQRRRRGPPPRHLGRGGPHPPPVWGPPTRSPPPGRAARAGLHRRVLSTGGERRMTAVRDELEANGEGFTPSRLLDVRDRTRAALWEIAGRMAPGMSEEDARSTATDVLRVRRLRKGWHKVLVRF